MCERQTEPETSAASRRPRAEGLYSVITAGLKSSHGVMVAAVSSGTERVRVLPDVGPGSQSPGTGPLCSWAGTGREKAESRSVKSPQSLPRAPVPPRSRTLFPVVPVRCVVSGLCPSAFLSARSQTGPSCSEHILRTIPHLGLQVAHLRTFRNQPFLFTWSSPSSTLSVFLLPPKPGPLVGLEAAWTRQPLGVYSASSWFLIQKLLPLLLCPVR